MLVRMPMIGAGTNADPLEVALPTWRCIVADEVGRWMIVDVPPEDAPDDVDAPDTPRRPRLSGLPVVVGLTVAQRVKWHLKLARRWGGIIDPPKPDLA